jgi:hypothetical protein
MNTVEKLCVVCMCIFTCVCMHARTHVCEETRNSNHFNDYHTVAPTKILEVAVKNEHSTTWV